ncbi:hypothetical protein [Streptomyces torulosus]|uniref:hypothetical protein n=1 Tax=Streptomyces torulosus TaxID=68276 RepID=UPI0006EB8CFF|nr:hypothetical protein [Streptomyces torulosus]
MLAALRPGRGGDRRLPKPRLRGDILGARLTHAQLRNRRTGRGLTVDPRSGEPINVQIPETRLD